MASLSDETERLNKYFETLQDLIPQPDKNWELNVRPCRWAKILEERSKSLSGPRNE
jgi:hypothetical protein